MRNGSGLVLALTLCCCALPFVVTATENSGKVVARGTFALWFLAIFVALPVAASVTTAVQRAFVLLWWPVGMIAIYLYQRVVVRRCRDAGLPKAVAYLGGVPVLNVALGVYLLLKPSAAARVSTAGG
jgi:hypothetical protein